MNNLKFELYFFGKQLIIVMMPHLQLAFTDGLLGYTHNEAIQELLNQVSIKQEKKESVQLLHDRIFELRSTKLDGILDKLCKDDMRDQLHNLAGNLKALIHCTFFCISMNTYNTGLYKEDRKSNSIGRSIAKLKMIRPKETGTTD